MISLLTQDPITFLGAILAFLIAVMAHEVAHGYVALKCGDPTAKYMGRLNFNPQSHFDLFGAVLFLVIGFGYARPVPINPDNFKNYKKDSIKVSLAGVATNFTLAFLVYPIFYLAIPYIIRLSGYGDIGAGFSSFFIAFLQYFFSINLVLMVFNLMPIPPLDGFRFLELVLPATSKVMDFLRKNSFMVLIVFMLANMYFGVISLVTSIVQQPIIWFWGLIL
ncbi:MAG: site-2 protease family protein [Bacillota bacterium]